MLKHQVNRFRTICTVCGFVALSWFKFNPLYCTDSNLIQTKRSSENIQTTF
ncbi:hypothetical protein NEISICOT_00564 [Neisseria sicca ATCC 29256]|uniref:Uncharacterized protein n=1 Tax=Neisseria sicca ATCC 29256 TaxID=547045 RepID=C6M226_NEISI|nr:hypothetical protein NEISICOT_00564 [Neisseria sicca ATCC 29256]